jgi:hypothetical protein
VSGLGRLLIASGLILAALGVLVLLGDKLPFRLGRLPGDIVWQGKNTRFYFPITTLVLLNLVLFFLVRLFSRH